MTSIRQRIPFKFQSDDADADDHILDEQEQEDLIVGMKRVNDEINRQYILSLQVVLGLSTLLQLLTFQSNPLLAVFPHQETSPSLPLPGIFVVVSLFIHFNLMLCSMTEERRQSIGVPSNLFLPLSFGFLYTLAAVAPTLSLFLQRSWQTTIWSCVTLVVVYFNQGIMDTIQKSEQSIAELHSLRYNAKGA
ncbi:hypothetical protein CVT24_010662 [Panaeolus cyanescens]|uniref:Uncharacterized protein n=1 Tax=Panaeolus cyanescens TaxID=181874 RepID=A0A409YLY6_9AGAR|nr:hypothetical protein CVT24_010662 [Panaeolus cyanescens]